MTNTNSAPKKETAIQMLMLDNHKDLNLNELRDLFLTVSRTFVENLDKCKVEELRSIQIYMRKIKHEIETKDPTNAALKR